METIETTNSELTLNTLLVNEYFIKVINKGSFLDIVIDMIYYTDQDTWNIYNRSINDNKTYQYTMNEFNRLIRPLFNPKCVLTYSDFLLVLEKGSKS